MRRQGLNSDGVEITSAFVEQLVDTSISFEGTLSLTRQEFADECDINNIMSKYQQVGVVSHINPAAPLYVDYSDAPDLVTALNMLRDADDQFMQLPAKVRREFDNDPVKFVEFASNEENIDKMREWGLAPPEVVPEPPMRVEVVNPPPLDAGAPAPAPEPRRPM